VGRGAVSGRQQQRAAWSCAGAAPVARPARKSMLRATAIAVQLLCAGSSALCMGHVSSLGSKFVRLPGVTGSVQGGILVL